MPLLNKSSTINTLQPIRYTLPHHTLLFKLFLYSRVYSRQSVGHRRTPVFIEPFMRWNEFSAPRKLWTTTHRHTHDENREISTGVRLNQQVKLQRWAERRVDHRVGIVNNIPPCGRSKGKRDFPSETRRGIKRWREGGAEVSVNRLGKIRKED